MDENIKVSMKDIVRNAKRYSGRPHPPLCVIGGRDRIYEIRYDAHKILYGHTRYLEAEEIEKQRMYERDYGKYIDKLIVWIINILVKDNPTRLEDKIYDYNVNTLMELLRENILIKDDIERELKTVYHHYRKQLNPFQRLHDIIFGDRYRILYREV
ncbi:MAG TPA: hypothetical protein VK190_03540 [Pseudoneobacillus sp.]|nr:hypothetical protein [Pseudoneobacillus sp.]